MNCLSIDLESFVHINPKNNLASEDRKREDNCYIVKAVEDILALLKKNNTKATFFVLGEIYEWYPELIEKIADEGHEIGYHSHTHRIIENELVMAEEAKKSKKFIEKFKPKGFRAPQMFLKKESLEVLKDDGFVYDSSVYGKKAFDDVIKVVPVTTSGNVKKEYPQPLSVRNLLKFPVGSGFFFGIFGSRVVKMSRGNDFFMFVHPWQIAKFPLKRKILEALKDPRIIPYMKNRRKSFEKLLSNNRFFPFIRFLEEKE